MSNNLKRKIKRKKSLKDEKQAEKELQNKISNIFLPDNCSLCNKVFNKKSRDMAMNWMVVAEGETKALVCPSCWEKSSNSQTTYYMIRIIVEKKSYNKENINEKKDKRGATPAYCKRTPCKKMGFTQKASCKSQDIKDCYRGKKNESNFYSPGFKNPKDFPKIKAKIAYIGYAGTVNGGFLEEKKRDPKVGTGKKPKGSSRRLYTDENPKDTVSVKFRTAADIRRTLAKKSFKAKSHKRQSQIINLIHQRVRAAYQNAKDPKTKKRLKTAFDYATQRKEASKEKTKRLNKKK